MRAHSWIRVSCLLGFFAAALVARAARGQGGQGGAIVGYVSDGAGAPLAGVKVLASSPTQIGGEQAASTNAQGRFRLGQLFPGTFQVTASAPGWRTVVHRSVLVGISAPAEVNVVLHAPPADGAGEIVREAPAVGTRTAHLEEVYDLDFLRSMPLPSRDQVLTELLPQSAGAVGGRLRGGDGNQTVFIQDGFEVRDRYALLEAAAAYEIQSAGYGADNAAAPAGILSLVTRTGSNRWQVGLNATAENDALRFSGEGDPSAGSYYVVTPAVAGPILRDELWFAFAVESHRLARARAVDLEGILPGAPPFRAAVHQGTLKVTWQTNVRNRLTFLGNFDGASGSNLKRDLGVAQEAQQNRRAGLSGLWGVIWEAALADDLRLRSQAAYSQRPQYWYPWLCEDGDLGTCDAAPAIVNRYPRRTETANAAYGCDGTIECANGRVSPHRRQDLFSWQASNQLDYFLDQPLLGEHHLQLRHRLYSEKEVFRQAQPGDHFDEYNGADVPEARTTFFSSDPRLGPARQGWWIGADVIHRSNASFSETWRPTRHLTFTGAISHLWSKGQNSSGGTAVDSASWAPSLAGAWDATHDGRTVIRGSASQYVDLDLRTAALHTIGGQTQQRCLWNAATGAYDRDCVFSGGASRNTIGSPCGPTGRDAAGASCQQPLTPPRTFEYTLGGEREVVPGVTLALDGVYRRFTNQYQLGETNRIWNASGTAVIGYRNGRNETVIDLGTPASARRSYRGATLALEKRRGTLRGHASYTLADSRGPLVDPFANPFGAAGGDLLVGPRPDDRRHAVKAAAIWSASRWLTLGVRYHYGSGLPQDFLYRNEVTGTYETYRARRGVNPGTALPPAETAVSRFPDIQELDLQVRFSLSPLAGHQLDLYADALDLLSLRDGDGGADEGPGFGGGLYGSAPFRLRLGLSYRF